jgi:hypothetical protein
VVRYDLASDEWEPFSLIPISGVGACGSVDSLAPIYVRGDTGRIRTEDEMNTVTESKQTIIHRALMTYASTLATSIVRMQRAVEEIKEAELRSHYEAELAERIAELRMAESMLDGGHE